MRDEQNAGGETANSKRKKRYILVAKTLKNTNAYTKTKELAASVDMDPKKFAASIQKAKELLASMGYMVTNRIKKKTDAEGTGYKNASFQEFEAEIHKSCARATAHIMQALKLVSLLESSKTLEFNSEGLKQLLLQNAHNISFPSVGKEMAEYSQLKPSFLDEIANDYIEEEEPDDEYEDDDSDY